MINEESKKLRKKSILINTIISSSTVLALYLLFIYFNKSGFEAHANSIEDYRMYFRATVGKSGVDMFFQTFIIVCISSVIILFTFINLYSYDINYFKRISKFFSKNPVIQKTSLKKILLYILISSAILIPTLLALYIQDNQNTNKYYQKRNTPEVLKEIISKDTLSSHDKTFLYAYGKKGSSMDLTPFHNKGSFDLGLFGKLERLEIFGEDIESTDNNKIQNLTLHDPVNALVKYSFPYLNSLLLIGRTDTLPEIKTAFPYLYNFIFSGETIAVSTAESFRSPTANLGLSIISDGIHSTLDINNIPIKSLDSLLRKKYLKMDWFTEEHGKCIIQNARFSEESENLDKIKRLIMMSLGENPEAILPGMTNLEWLYISYNKKHLQIPSLWISLRDAINRDMKQLQSLEINSAHYTSREDMNQAINVIIENSQHEAENLELGLELEDITSEVRKKYNVDFVYAYRIINFTESRLNPKNPEINGNLKTGDILISRQANKESLCYQIYNSQTSSSYGFSLYMMDELGLVTENWFVFK